MGIYFVFFLPPKKRKGNPIAQTTHLATPIHKLSLLLPKELFLATRLLLLISMEQK
jgi:hypothetical protein